MDIELLKLLVEALKSVQADYLHNFWATMGAYLLAAGWLFTSKEARAFLKGHDTLMKLAQAVIAGIYVIHIAVLFAAHKESSSLTQLISTLDIFTPKVSATAISAPYQIQWYWPLVSALINGLLAGLIVAQIRAIRSEK